MFNVVGEKMSDKKLLNLAHDAWLKHIEVYDINIEPCDEFDFKEGFFNGYKTACIDAEFNYHQSEVRIKDLLNEIKALKGEK